MKKYFCECGKEFNDPQKFNGHKSHCKIHMEACGKTYDMNIRVTKAKQTIQSTYGTLQEYSKIHSEKIKQSFQDRQDTFNYIVSNIDKKQFIHDYIECNNTRKYIMEKYCIPSEYMIDKIIDFFNCHKDKKQSAKIGLKTKQEIFGNENFNNWKKGHETRIKNSGSLEESYRIGFEKQKNTMLNKYGVECLFNDPNIETFRKKCNTSPNNHFSNMLQRCGLDFTREFVIGLKSYDFKIGNTLVEINPTITHNSYRLPYPPYEGLQKDYHRLKSKLAEDNGFRCIHVWDWDNQEKIINLLRQREVLYARNCYVNTVSLVQYKEFLNLYHLQGYVKSDVCLGLYNNGNLVSIMSFGKPRYNNNFQFELLRYCTSYNVIGGYQKLFKKFVNLYSPKNIVSYCDRSKFCGNMYLDLGFKLKQTSLGRHWYNIKTKQHVTDNLLRQRGFDQLFNANFGKGTSNEQLMYEHGFLDVFDCGQSTFVWDSEGRY